MAPSPEPRALANLALGLALGTSPDLDLGLDFGGGRPWHVRDNLVQHLIGALYYRIIFILYLSSSTAGFQYNNNIGPESMAGRKNTE